MDALRNLTYQEQKILGVIEETTPVPLNYVALIYKELQSFDKTIAVINEAQMLGYSLESTLQEMGFELSSTNLTINKIEE